MSKQNLAVMSSTFFFNSINMRTALGTGNEPWFCARDVFNALDVIWEGKRSLKNLPKEWLMVGSHPTIQGERDTIFINEAALYKIIFRSNKPLAQDFANWVCFDVLPSIRKFGGYGTLTPANQVALRSQKIKLIQLLASADAFTFEAVINSLSCVCLQLREPMPDISLIGKDRQQLNLEV